MKKILMLLLIFSLVFASPTQTYVQKVDATGASSFQESREMAVFLQLLPPGALKKIADICIADPSLACSVNGTMITMRLQLPADNGYYTFGREYGFFTTTTMTINRIPTDLFDVSINRILSKAGVSSGEGSATAIDLKDKKANSAKAAAFREAGISMEYSVTMPGGTVQTFDLVAQLEDSKPIVLAENELNYWLAVLILGVIALAAFAYSFFGGKKKKPGKKQ